jgi:hypothetical protein
MELAANGLVHLTSSLAATLLVLSATAGPVRVAPDLSTRMRMDLQDLSAVVAMVVHLDQHVGLGTDSGVTDNTFQDLRISRPSASSLALRMILTKVIPVSTSPTTTISQWKHLVTMSQNQSLRLQTHLLTTICLATLSSPDTQCLHQCRNTPSPSLWVVAI